MFSLSNKLAIRFANNKMHKPEKIANDVKGELMKFRDYLPVIRSLCNPGLKDRHWKDINKVVDCDVDVHSKLSYLQTFGIAQFKDKLEDISETASKEYSNERILAKMNEDWAPMEFTCKEWKGSQILEGEAIELLQTLLDDHIIKT